MQATFTPEKIKQDDLLTFRVPRAITEQLNSLPGKRSANIRAAIERYLEELNVT